MKGLDKNKLIILSAVIAVLAAVVVFAVSLGSDGSTDEADSSQPALSIFSATDTAAPDESPAPEGDITESVTTTTTITTTTTTTTTTTPQETEPPDDYIEYSFRTKKLYDDHYKKHGAEFGDITQEEYLQLANDLLNSDSDTILHKIEAEDGDDVFFDTETGYFLVLSTDGYIRTFFIPSAGKAYYDRQ